MTEETINNNNTNNTDGETIKKLKQQLLFEKEKNNMLQKQAQKINKNIKPFFKWTNSCNKESPKGFDNEIDQYMLYLEFYEYKEFLQDYLNPEKAEKKLKLYTDVVNKDKFYDFMTKPIYIPNLFKYQDIVGELLLPIYENWLEEQNKNLTTKEGKKFNIPFVIIMGYSDGVGINYFCGEDDYLYGCDVHDLVEKKYQELLPKRQLQKDLIQYVKRQEFGTKENGKIKYEPSLIKSRFQSQILEFETIVDKLKEIGKEKEDEDEYIKSFLIWAYSGKDELIKNLFVKSFFKEMDKGKEEIQEYKKIIKTIDPKTTIIDWHHCLTQLYFDEESKDFEIIITDEKSNENNPTTIKVHKWVLVSRSGMFRNFFQSIEHNTTNQVTDYSKRSLSFWKIFIKYLYTSNIELEDKLDEKVINEFKEASDYFQLNDESNLLWHQLQKQIN
ncbi:btb/poz domain-containing protein [Anaeramoeba flamelloides]|uniref:Btb/poz domain-containing protein n=1 Tax=Anaeramoeba flamelloides TaxID=1746091 RepID=A0AAV7Y4E4_9EUKA|nr:btb/poz domain-containing protein [Anaeramoeba flamelloides]